MKFINQLFMFLYFCQTLVFSQELIEDSANPLANFVFDLPDIVANYKMLGGEEVQLEAFEARKVNCYIMKIIGNKCLIYFII